MGEPKDDGLRLCVLGRVRVTHGDVELPLGPPQRRAVLALLVLAEGKAVGRNELVDSLWPTAPPRQAANVIQTHVMHLRQLLEPDRPSRVASRVLPSAGTGYRLDPEPFEVDLLELRDLMEKARAARAADDHPAVRTLTGATLRLWQPPAADVPVLTGHPRVTAVTAEAELAFSWHVDAAIRLGQVEEVLPLVQEQARARPLDEHAQAQLMLCYLAVGRRADAFVVYDETRDRLVKELAVDPGPVLTEAHRELLLLDGAPGQPTHLQSWSPPVPAQLPADVVPFAGRTEELRWLDRLPASGQPLGVITGTAGVGKTTLAVHWAHQAARLFPDGQLYADLRGFDGSLGPVRPDDVVRAFLTALGVAPERIPVEESARFGLYRSLLAGRQVLILLDNARQADQVRPLLPGTSGCLVLVTSRNELSGLVAAGALPLRLGLMDDAEAHQLLGSRIGHERLAAAPEAVAQLVTACARLPLALAIVAARAHLRPRFPLAALSSQLRRSAGDLGAFAGDDEAFDARSVFSWSYRILTPAAQTAFRRLSLHPGPDLSAAAVAALVDVPRARVEPLMNELTRANLVVEHRPGRYSFHDLLRAYATEVAAESDSAEVRGAALQRVVDHYVAWTTLADGLIGPHRPAGLPMPTLDEADGAPKDLDDALAWFGTEHVVLLAIVERAAEHGFDRAVCDLAWNVTTYVDRRAYWHHQAAVQRLAVAAAERLGDRSLQARTHRGLARAYSRLGRFDDAQDELGRALAGYEALGDDAGRARTEMSLAGACELQGRYRDALGHAERALDLSDRVGDQLLTANARNAVGWCRAHLDDHIGAISHCVAALRLYRDLGELRGAADAWDSLGYAYHGLSRHGSAVRCFRRAVALFREVGDRFAEATSLTRLGDTHQAAGDLGAGRIEWRRALDILTELDHPDAEAVRTRLSEP